MSVVGCIHNDYHAKSLAITHSLNTNTIPVFDSLAANVIEVLNKLDSREKLSNNDYTIICTYLTNNHNDESLSEGFGYSIFTYLERNVTFNTDLSRYLSQYQKAYQDSVKFNLVKSMCIDIGEANYNYNQFVADFPIFTDCNAAQAAFNQCMENYLE